MKVKMSTTQQEKPYRLIPYFDVTCQCGARITSNKQINECSHCKSEIEWNDLIETHNADIANRIVQLKLMLHAADEANECLRHDILVRDALIARFRAQLAQRSGLVPADKAVR